MNTHQKEKGQIPFFKSAIRAVKKSWLTLAGLFILTAAWYFEKISIETIQGQIDNSQREIVEFRDFMEDVRITQIETEMLLFNSKHDPNHSRQDDLIFAYGNACTAQFALMKTEEMMSVIENKEVESKRADFMRQVNEIEQLKSTNNLKLLQEQFLKNQKKLGHQTDSALKKNRIIIINESSDMDSTRRLYLMFYAIGILCVTLDKGWGILRAEKDARAVHIELLQEIRKIAHEKKNK